MKIKYIYKNIEYASTFALRKAIWENDHKIIRIPKENLVEEWAKFGVTYQEISPSEEEIAAQELVEAKRERAAQVAAITVEVDGMLFNGDETSQDRMTRALQVAEITGMESTNWVLANDQVATVTVAQMKQALAKSMLTQGSYWTKPYDNAEEEVTEDAAS